MRSPSSRRSRPNCWPAWCPASATSPSPATPSDPRYPTCRPPMNALDFGVSFLYPEFVPSWENPQGPLQKLIFVVDTRYSAVLGIVFGQKADWSELAMTFLMTLTSRVPDRGDGVPVGRGQADARHHRRGARVVRRHTACARGRFLLSHSGEGQRSDRRTRRFVQHHDGEPGAADRGGQGKGAAGIGTRDRARRAESALPQGRAVHQIAGIERRVQSRPHGIGRLLRFHGAAR